jgi:hypothetical protein
MVAFKWFQNERRFAAAGMEILMFGFIQYLLRRPIAPPGINFMGLSSRLRIAVTDRGYGVKWFRQDLTGILRRVEWPANIEDDPVSIHRAEFNAVATDLLGGAVNSQLKSGHSPRSRLVLSGDEMQVRVFFHVYSGTKGIRNWQALFVMDIDGNSGCRLREYPDKGDRMRDPHGGGPAH